MEYFHEREVRILYWAYSRNMKSVMLPKRMCLGISWEKAIKKIVLSPNMPKCDKKCIRKKIEEIMPGIVVEDSQYSPKSEPVK